MLLLAIGATVAASGSTLLIVILGRMIEGLGSSSIAIVGFATVAARVDQPERASAYAALTAVCSIVIGATPLLGAAVNDVVGWRAVLALPAVALLVAPVLRRTAVPSSPGRQQVDPLTAVIALTLATAVTALIQARATNLAPVAVVALCVVCAACAAAGVWRLRVNPEGLLPKDVLHNPEIAWLSLGAGSIFGAYLGTSVLFPVLLVNTSSIQAGLLLLPAAAVAAVTACVVGTRTFAPSRQLLHLALWSMAGIVATAASGGSPFLISIAAILLVSCWAGAQVIGLATVPRSVAVDDQGVGFGVFNFLFVIGGSFGAALAGATLSATGATTAALVLASMPAVCLISAVRLASRRTGTAEIASLDGRSKRQRTR
jgi:MFS family permease